MGKLIHDFYCTDAKDMNYGILSCKVKYFKEDKEGVISVCKIMEESCEEAAVRSAVEMCQEFGATMAEAVEKIIKKFNLSEEDAIDKVKEF